MSLIDISFFQGEINIPNSVRQSEFITAIIDKREPEILKRLLGLNMYRDFIIGLQQPVIEARWTKLLSGTDYVVGTTTREWEGLVSVGGTGVTVVDALNTIMIQVGRGQTVAGGYLADDPVTGANSISMPPTLIGKPFVFVHKLLGQMDPDEYQVVGNTLKLLPTPATTFQINDRYYFKAAALLPGQSTGIAKRSLIANYVYYWYTRAMATQSTGIGETIAKTDNSVRNNPARKQTRAWNEMISINYRLKQFIEFNATDYGEYAGTHCWDRELFKTINTGNL